MASATGVLRASVLRSLNTKLLGAVLALGLVPLVIIGFLAVNRGTNSLADAASERMKVAAVEAGDKIDRNLFERYGDVQAFAANPLAQGTPAERTGIIDFLTATYGIYDLMLVVDLDGRVTAANTIDGFGDPIDTSGLIGTSVAGEDWFQTVASGNVPEGGTLYTDAYRSDLVTSTYGDQRVTLPFTAPIYDAGGQIVGVWHNEASFERVVSDIMNSTRAELIEAGVTTVETQVIRSDGLLIDDASSDAILEFNLADAGIVAAQRAIGADGQSGTTREVHARRGVEQFNGWASTDGALGFPGYDWGILVREDTEEALASAATLRNQMLGIGGVMMAIVAVLAYLVARSVSRPVTLVRERALAIASGDMNVEDLHLRRDDELGDLATSFNEMSAMLSTVDAQARAIADGHISSPVLDEEIPGQLGEAFGTMVSSIKQMVTQLTTSSRKLADAAGELTEVSASMGNQAELTSSQAISVSATGEEVSSNVSTVAAAIEEMNSSIREVANNATEASNVASDAVVVSQETSARIGELGQSSEEIGDVIKVINSIAEQTNLLALNATIEAARAGEAGKGFAVVANEVKELANQTAQATDEISTRIQAIQAATTTAVQANEQIGETIDRINEISTTIATAVEQQSATTSEIGRSVEEAARGTDEIARSISDVAAAAESTRDSTSDTRTAAESMAQLANQLNQLVAHYR